jgi:hypothetical protein
MGMHLEEILRTTGRNHIEFASGASKMGRQIQISCCTGAPQNSGMVNSTIAIVSVFTRDNDGRYLQHTKSSR